MYNGQSLSLDELSNLPEGMFRVINEKGAGYNNNFIPPGPAIKRDDLRGVVESLNSPDKAVIIDDFVTHSKFRHLFEGRK